MEIFGFITFFGFIVASIVGTLLSVHRDGYPTHQDRSITSEYEALRWLETNRKVR